MGFPQGNILLVESVDSINHLLDQLDLAVAQPVLVGDVVGHSGLSARLSPGSFGLKVELLTPGGKHLGSKLGPSYRETLEEEVRI